MAMVALEITDDLTGKTTVVRLSMHSAQKLYGALRELVGDVQYGVQPGQLVTVPDARLKIT